MNSTLQTLTTLLLVFTLTCCVSSQDKNANLDSYSLTKDAPFKITEAYFQKWVAGVQGGGKGTNVYIKLENLNESITIKNLYFQDKMASLISMPLNSNTYEAKFKEEINNDLVMDSDVTKEAANIPPVKTPFNLEKNEAVISYIENNQLEFFKISALPEKPMLAYPAINPNKKQ